MLPNFRICLALVVALAGSQLYGIHEHQINGPQAYRPRNKLYKRDAIFNEVMGISEQTLRKAWQQDTQAYRKLIKQHMVPNQPTAIRLKNSTGGQEYDAGTFELMELGFLRRATQDLPKSAKGRFNLILGYKTHEDSWFRHLVDVGALQADSANRDAVFQVASNFSGLEPISAQDYPENGLSNYIYDYTQGPFAALSAAPGIIRRMYYAWYNPATDPVTWRQTKEHQINFLHHLKDILPVVNGYVDLTKLDALKLKTPLTQDQKQHIALGFHEDIQVTGGLVTGTRQEAVVDRHQHINQAFTAAIDFGSLNAKLRENPFAQAKAQALLEAAYEGTLRAALVKHKKKVFLTLIGGGVFANSLEWIAHAIEQNGQLIQNSGLDVTLVIYSSEYTPFVERMLKLVHNTQGVAQAYKNDGIYTLRLSLAD